MKEIQGHKKIIWLMGLIGLMGCSSDNAHEAIDEMGSPVEVMGFVAEYQEAGDTRAPEAAGTTWTTEAPEAAGRATRGWTPPSGFYADEGEPKVIGIFFTQNGQTPEAPESAGHFFYGGGKWRTNITGIETQTYYLYGYVPHTAGVSCTVTDLTGGTSAFSSGATMNITNLPTMTSGDVCVVVGAKNGKSDYQPYDDYTVTGLQQGSFTYEAKETSETEATGNYVYLLFDHLYAALRIRMRVENEYNKLRTIKLKGLSLNTFAGAVATKKKVNVTVKLQATTDGSSPIVRDGENELITFTQTGTETGESEVFSSKEGMTLTSEYSSYLCHFMPQGITKLVLTSVYDVYDKQGNLIRKDCEATNTIGIDAFYTQTAAKRGYRYTIDMTIKPSFLYVLSEPDLDNPTLTLSTTN